MTAHFIPRLCLRDPAAAAEQLAQVFGFRADGNPNRLRLGDQIIELHRDAAAAGHGRIDHLALAVDDVDAALAAASSGVPKVPGSNFVPASGRRGPDCRAMTISAFPAPTCPRCRPSSGRWAARTWPQSR